MGKRERRRRTGEVGVDEVLAVTGVADEGADEFSHAAARARGLLVEWSKAVNAEVNA